MANKKKAAKKAAPAAKKAAPKKAAPKKAAPAAKKAAAPKKAAKKAAPAAKKAAAPKKAAPKKAAPAPKKAASKPAKAPAAPKKAAAKSAPASTQHSTKPKTTKPVVKKEPKKAAKPVVIPKTSTDKARKYEPEFTKSVLDTPDDRPVGPSMRYSDSDLKEFRELIMRKLEAAKKELNYLQGLITRKDESGELDEGRYMTMEDGSVSMEREQLSQMASRQIQFIDHLEKALMRIESKTYGICRVTGKLIDKARLRAVPHATLSIEAKQMMNR